MIEMKYLKMLGVTAVAAMALMAFAGAGSASATKLCTNNLSTTFCSAHEPIGTTVEATLSGTSILETTGGTVLDTCTGSTVKGKTSNTAATGEPVKVKVETLSWLNCTRTTHTLKTGELQIHHIANTDDGTLTATGIQWTVQTIFGSCVYGPVGSLDLGTVHGGNPAVITINTIVPKLSGTCPSEARLTAHYTITTPKPLYITHN
jgi:hypothetical protein